MSARVTMATICYEIPAPRVKALRGWVTELGYQTIYGAQLSVFFMHDGRQELVATVETDANGAFSVSGLEPGTYLVEVKAVGFNSGRQKVELVSGSSIWGKRLLFSLPQGDGCFEASAISKREFTNLQKRLSGRGHHLQSKPGT